MKTNINYFNEALLLATRICNWTEDTDLDLPIDYQKYDVAKEQLDLEYQDLVHFFRQIRQEGRTVLKSFPEIDIFFKHYRSENTPEILYFLTYSKLEETIHHYSEADLLSVITSEFRNNMQSLGYDLSPDFHFHEVDHLKLFNEQQRYQIYKLLHNINHTFDQFYQFMLSLEQVIKNHESLLFERFEKVYRGLDNQQFKTKELQSTIDSLTKSHMIVDFEFTIFLQFSQLFGVSLFSEGELTKGYCYFGLVPCLLEGKPKSVEEKKEDIVQKLSLISDPTRFNIIFLLSKKSMYGREISEKLSISTGTISHHLSHLIKANLIQSEIQGKRIYYRVNQAEISRMGQFLLQLGGRQDESHAIEHH